jgi:hypothetical protein
MVCGQRAEQSLRLILEAGGEVDRVRISARTAVARRDCPQILDRDGFTVWSGKLAIEVVVGEIIGINRAIPKITTNRSPASWPKLCGAIARSHGEFSLLPDAT